MQSLTRQQLLVLIVLTLIWGFNWPIMKLGVTGFPPLTFRALCFAIAIPVMWLGLRAMRVPLTVQRKDWRQLFKLSIVNCLAWHATIVLAVGQLSSGRAAVLGYTMPIFSAVIGAFIYGDKLTGRALAAVGATGLGVVLLLWNEASHMAGKPLGVLLAIALIWVFTKLARGSDGLPLFVIHLPPETALQTALLAVVCGVLAAVAPARRAARLDPAQAIRL